MNKKIVIFDFDGVIVNTFKIYTGISRELNPDMKLTDKQLRAFFEKSVLDSPIFKYNNQNLFFKKYGPKLLRLRPVRGMKQNIKTLVKDYTLVIISSSDSSLIKKFLKKHNLLGQFNSILGADVEKSKIIKIKNIVKKYQVKPKDRLFITDTLGDILEARKAKVESIGVTWGYHTKTTINKSHPYKIITKPSQLLKNVKQYFQT